MSFRTNHSHRVALLMGAALLATMSSGHASHTRKVVSGEEGDGAGINKLDITNGQPKFGGGESIAVPQGLSAKFDDPKQARGSTAAGAAQMVRDFRHGPAAAAQVQ